MTFFLMRFHVTRNPGLNSELCRSARFKAQARYCLPGDHFQPSAHIFHFPIPTLSWSQIPVQSPSEQLQKHLKANPRQGRIIPPFGQLVTDERMLSPRQFVETEGRARLVQGLANQIATFRWDVVVPFAEDL